MEDAKGNILTSNFNKRKSNKCYKDRYIYIKKRKIRLTKENIQLV